MLPRPPFTGGVRPTGVRAGVRGPRADSVKLPGSVIQPGARDGKPVQGSTGTQAPSDEIKATEPPRQAIIAGGGGGFMPVSVRPAVPPPWMPENEDELEDELDVELEEAPAEPAPVEPAPQAAPSLAPKTLSKLPLYAGIALLAYLLTR